MKASQPVVRGRVWNMGKHLKENRKGNSSISFIPISWLFHKSVSFAVEMGVLAIVNNYWQVCR